MTTNTLEWLARARADLANHRTALDWMLSTGDSEGAGRLAGALGWFWTLDGLLTEACTQLESVLTFHELPASARTKVAWSLALVVASLGDLRRAAELARASIAAAGVAGLPVQAAYGLNALAVAHWGLGELDAAEASRAESIRIFDEHTEMWGSALSRVLRGRTALDRADLRAGDLVDDGLRAALAAGDRHLIGMAHEQIARLALDAADLDRAIEHARDAIRHHEEIGYTEGTLAARHVLGLARLDAGDVEAALDEHRCALAAARAIGHRAAMCEALDGIALALHAGGDSERAWRIVAAVTGERDRLGVPRRPADRRRLTALAPAEPDAGALGVGSFDDLADRMAADA